MISDLNSDNEVVILTKDEYKHLKSSNNGNKDRKRASQKIGKLILNIISICHFLFKIEFGKIYLLKINKVHLFHRLQLNIIAQEIENKKLK